MNEAGNIARLVEECQALHLDQAELSVLVVDNGSSDNTAEEAIAAGAQVVSEPRRGYGYACAAGVLAATEARDPGLPGRRFQLPAGGDASRSWLPCLAGQADLVQGSRELGKIAPGAMPIHQRLGNRLATGMIRLLYGFPITDLGPYRAIRRQALLGLHMREMTYGWPTEMTVKAARQGLRIVEVPVSFHPRRARSFQGKRHAARHAPGSLVYPGRVHPLCLGDEQPESQTTDDFEDPHQVRSFTAWAGSSCLRASCCSPARLAGRACQPARPQRARFPGVLAAGSHALMRWPCCAWSASRSRSG